MSSTDHSDQLSPGRRRLHEIIYEADTPAGRLFDVGLLIAILISVGIVMLESVPSIEKDHGELLRAAEWVLTILFTIEYFLRIIAIGKPFKYIFSFYGLVDLLAVIPTYFGLFFSGTHSLSVIRALRLLRVFRVLKLGRYLGQGRLIIEALRASRPKIVVFLFAVLTLCLIMGTAMYLIESPSNEFNSIPRSVYWAIVTLTTVGYGDISPDTPLGQAVASIIMIMGYAIIAVPTGIVTAEISKSGRSDKVSTQACSSCSREGHDTDAKHCKYCGAEL